MGLSLDHCGARCVALGLQTLLSKSSWRRMAGSPEPRPLLLPICLPPPTCSTPPPVSLQGNRGDWPRLQSAAVRRGGTTHGCVRIPGHRCICYILSLLFIGVFPCMFLLVAPEQGSCCVPAGAGAGARTLFSPRTPHAYVLSASLAAVSLAASPNLLRQVGSSPFNR